MLLKSDAAADVLADGLRQLGIRVEHANLGDTDGHLRKDRGCYVLTLDETCDAERLCRIMREALAAIAFGPEAATSARPARPHLRLVS